MSAKQSALIGDLKLFLQKLSEENYPVCRTKVQSFKKCYKIQWVELTAKCTSLLNNYQKQIKELRKLNAKFISTIRSKNKKSNPVDKIKNGIAIKEELRDMSKIRIFNFLEERLYQFAFQQVTNEYEFINRLKEYDYLHKILEASGVDEEVVVDHVYQSQFYSHMKKLLINDNKKDQEFQIYALKISQGERLQIDEQPRYLSKRFYDILFNLQKKLNNQSNYTQENYNKEQFITRQIQILKEIYRQILGKQLKIQVVGIIQLENQLKILLNDLSNWKNDKNKIKYETNDHEIMIDDRTKIKSIYERNQELQKMTKQTSKRLLQIVNNQICMEIQSLYPEDQYDTNDIINCIEQNTQKMEEKMEQFKQKIEQLSKKLKKEIDLKNFDDSSSQMYFNEKKSLFEAQQVNTRQRQQIIKLQEQIENYIQEIVSYQRKNKFLVQSLNKSERQNEIFKKQFKEVKEEIQRCQKQIMKYQKKLNKQTAFMKQKQNELLQSMLVSNIQKKKTFQGLQQSILYQQPPKNRESICDSTLVQKLSKKNEELKEEIQKLLLRQKQLQMGLKQKAQSYKKQIQRQKIRYDTLMVEYNQLEHRLESHMKNLEQTHKINLQLEKQFNMIKSESLILQIPLQQKNDIENNSNQEMEVKLRKQIDLKQEKIKKYQQQKKLLKQRIKQLEDKYLLSIKQQQDRVQKYKLSQRQVWQKVKKDLDIERQNHKRTKQSLAVTKSQIVRIKQEGQIFYVQNQSLTKQINLLKTAEPVKRQSSLKNSNNFFNSKGIFEDNQQKQYQYLIKTLESRCGKILKTKLLYYYDPLNKTNFHRYVDSHKNIVVIVKTLYGKLIAGFSESQINPRGVKLGFGLLMSLWKQLSWQIIPEKRPVTYDDYYIIFGNSQIRLRSQQDKIFSNFGISNGFFNAGKSKIEDLLGQRERQTDITSYEFYEVIFSQ